MKAAKAALAPSPEVGVAPATADAAREGKGRRSRKSPDVREQITFLALHPKGALKELPPSILAWNEGCDLACPTFCGLFPGSSNAAGPVRRSPAGSPAAGAALRPPPYAGLSYPELK